MSLKTILLIILFIWGIPSTYFRSRFRKIVYQTDDWKINIKPVFIQRIKSPFYKCLSRRF
jgi:peroxiredoxin Q/BCP